MTRNLDEAFNELMETVGLGDLKEGSEERIERKRMFFAGCIWMMNQFTEVFPEIDDEEVIIQKIEEYDIEIENFMAGIELGYR